MTVWHIFFPPDKCHIHISVNFTGENCDSNEIETGQRQGQDVEGREQSSNAGMVAGVIVATLIFSAVVLLLLLYYRRRVNSLKTELAHHVQYRADPGVSPG